MTLVNNNNKIPLSTSCTLMDVIGSYLLGCYLPGYRFTKGLAQNLNLRTHLKLEYTIKSLNNIQKNYIFQAWFLLYWTMSFNFLTCSMVLKLLQ